MFDVMTFKTNDGILHSAVTIVTFDRDVVIMSQPIHKEMIICEPWSNMPYDIKQMFGYGIPLHKEAYPYSDVIDINNHMTFQLIMMHFLQFRLPSANSSSSIADDEPLVISYLLHP